MSDSIVELEMNLEDYEDYEPLPAGTYPAQIQSAEKRISDKGNEYFYVVFMIHPDHYPPDYDVSNAAEGTKLTYARMQVPTADNRRSITAIKSFYRALGLKLKTTTINPGDWEGKEANLVIKKGEYNGTPTAEIAAVEARD